MQRGNDTSRSGGDLELLEALKGIEATRPGTPERLAALRKFRAALGLEKRADTVEADAA